MEKESTSVFILKSIKNHAKTNPRIKSLSDWINDTYPAEHMDLEREQARLAELKKAVQESEERIHQLQAAEDENLLAPELHEWFRKQAPVRLAKGADRKALRRWFNNTYGQKFSQKQFDIHLDEALEELS